MGNWEREKACKARRALALGAEMDAAIEAADRERFEAVYYKTFHCMNAKVRKSYYKRFLTQMAGKEGAV